MSPGGGGMKKEPKREKERTARSLSMRLDPEERLCPRFDSAGIALFPVAARGEMGFRVVSDFCQEHIM